MDDSPKPESNVGPVDGVATEKTKAGFSDIAAALFNGLGVGLLLGLLLGLAVSPVVSAFIGSISSILILLIGLKENYFNVVKSVRIGAFGLFAVAGILAGFYIRSHSPLAPSLMELKIEYDSLGYSEQEVRDFIAYQEFGLIPEAWVGRIAVAGDSSAKGKQFALAQQTNLGKRNNVLFSSTVNVGECYQLESSHDQMPFAGIKHNYTSVGGTWQELAENMDIGLPEDVKVKSLLLIRDVFCTFKDKKTVKIKCTRYDVPVEKIPLAELKKSLAESDLFWKEIVAAMDVQIAEKYHQKLYVVLTNTFCHD